MEQYLLPCFTKWLFGIDCPGCGLQRALLYLLKGNIQAAWQQYPPVFTTVLLVISALLYLQNKLVWRGYLLVFFVVVNSVFVVISYYFRVIHYIFIS